MFYKPSLPSPWATTFGSVYSGRRPSSQLQHTHTHKKGIVRGQMVWPTGATLLEQSGRSMGPAISHLNSHLWPHQRAKRKDVIIPSGPPPRSCPVKLNTWDSLKLSEEYWWRLLPYLLTKLSIRPNCSDRQVHLSYLFLSWRQKCHTTRLGWLRLIIWDVSHLVNFWIRHVGSGTNMGMVRVCLQGQSKSHLIFAGKDTKTKNNNNNNNHDTSFNHVLSRGEGDVCHSVASDHIVAKHVWTVNTEHELRPWEMTGCLICIAESQMETTAAEAAVGSYRCSDLTSRRVGALERCLQWEVPY